MCSLIFRPGSNLSGPEPERVPLTNRAQMKVVSIIRRLCLVFLQRSGLSGSIIKGFGFSSVQMCSPEGTLSVCWAFVFVSLIIKPIIVFLHCWNCSPAECHFSETRMMHWNVCLSFILLIAEGPWHMFFNSRLFFNYYYVLQSDKVAMLFLRY